MRGDCRHLVSLLLCGGVVNLGIHRPSINALSPGLSFLLSLHSEPRVYRVGLWLPRLGSKPRMLSFPSLATPLHVYPVLQRCIEVPYLLVNFSHSLPNALKIGCKPISSRMVSF